MKKLLSIALISVFCLTLFAGCGGKSTSFDAKNFADFKVIGLNGKAKAVVFINSTSVKTVCDSLSSKEGFETAMRVALVFDTLSFQTDEGSLENLSNGDKIKVVTTYAEKAAKEAKVKFTNTTFTYTVEGLKEGKTFDPFAEIEVIYSGVSPKVYVEIANRSQEQFVRDIRYQLLTKSPLRIGDKFSVEAYVDSQYADSEGYLMPDSLTKEFIVEGMDEYIQTYDDIPKSEQLVFQKEMQDLIESIVPIGDILINYMMDGYTSDKSKYPTTSTPELVKIYFCSPKQGGKSGGINNIIYYIYKTTVSSKKTSKTKDAYTQANVTNIIKPLDGTIQLNRESMSSSYSYQILDSIEEINAKFITVLKNNYEVQEISLG